jgi:hypothetical protein
MSSRPSLLSATLVLALLAGCSRNASPSQSDESGGTSSGQMQNPANDTARGPAVFFVKNSGVRCITHPCPTFLITRPDRPGEEPLQVHELDLSALNVDDEKRNQLELATFHEPGLKVEATLDTVPNAGPAGAATVLRVTRIVEGK